MRCFILLATALPVLLRAQWTLHDIWLTDTYTAMPDAAYVWGENNTYLTWKNSEGKYRLEAYSLKTNKKVRTLISPTDLLNAPRPDIMDFDDCEVSGKFVLFSFDTRHIYRHSYEAKYCVFNTETKAWFWLSSGDYISYPEFSPDKTHICYVKRRNLYKSETNQFTEVALTTQGSPDSILCGTSDWLYEEEFGLTKAFFWSPDSRFIAFLTFDETAVSSYSIQIWDGAYPSFHTYKYPKTGTKIATVQVQAYDTKYGETFTLLDLRRYEVYVPRIQWVKKDILSVRVLNRMQDTLVVMHLHALDATRDTLLQITDPAYVEVDDNFKYTDSSLFFLSEMDGYKHLYRFDWIEKKLQKLTKGNYEILEILHVDPQKQKVYFLSNELNIFGDQLGCVSTDGKEKFYLQTTLGVHLVSFNPQGTFVSVRRENYNQAGKYALYAIVRDRLVEVTQKIKGPDKKPSTSKVPLEIRVPEFRLWVNDQKDTLKYYLLKPKNIPEGIKLPVLMYVYGGPGSQEVMDDYPTRSELWHQVLLENGYMIACLDNRGTGGKGAYIKKCTTGLLGIKETEDQIAFARFLAKMPEVDSTRIGIWGWSYGGYLSAMCLLQERSIFKAAISVAPVSDWRLYDAAYTERYMKLPQSNPTGYDTSSLLTKAHFLKGNYLLIHGTSDDNVHIQHTFALQEALINNGKQFQTFVYPNKTHSILGNHTRLHLFEMMHRFILNNL